MNWEVLAAALLSGVALWTSTGLLTKSGRLRRRLDKNVAIADKMPAGTVREHLQAVNTRLAAELIYHEHGRPRALISRTISVASAGALVIAAIDVVVEWSDSDRSAGEPATTIVGVLGGVLLVLNVARTLAYRIGVRQYVDRVAEPVPAGLVGGESPLTRGTTATTSVGGRLRRATERLLTTDVQLRPTRNKHR